CAGRAVAVDATVRLLENEARPQGYRPVEGVARGQVARQDQHALGMERAAQFDFAFDVDHLARTRAHPRGDAAGPAEGEISDTGDRKAIDLPGYGALR